MDYCETSNRPIPYRSWFFRQIKSTMGRWMEPSKRILIAIATPETTTPPIPVGASENVWFGAAKTIFWMSNAIIIGIILANIC